MNAIKIYVCAQSLPSYLALWNLLYIPLDSSVHGIFLARVLEWDAIAFSTECLPYSNQLISIWKMDLKVNAGK